MGLTVQTEKIIAVFFGIETMKYKVDIYCDGIKLRTSPPHLSNITVAIRDCPV